MIEEDKNTEEQLQKLIEQPILKASEGSLSKNKRRRLLKSAVAIPVIMTLHSGAALARTSNLVGAITDTNIAEKITVKNQDHLLCIHADTLEGAKSTPVDLGSDPFSSVNIIMDANGAPDLARQAVTCADGNQTGIPGILISAAAFDSVGSKIMIRTAKILTL